MQCTGDTIMQFTIETMGQAFILRLQGALDTADVADLEQQLEKLLDDGARQLVVDCSELAYVSSSGLRVFLQAYKRLTAINGKLVLHSLNRLVSQIFETTGFTMMFPVFQSREEALRGLAVTGMLPKLRPSL